MNFGAVAPDTVNGASGILPAPREAYLSSEDVKTFYEQGYVVVKQAFRAQEITMMERLTNDVLHRIKGQQEIMTKPGSYLLDGTQIVIKQSENGTSISRVVGCGSMEPELLKILRSEKMVDTFFQLLGCEQIEHMICQFHPKEPNDGIFYRPHRDIENRQLYDENWKDVNGKGSCAVAIIAIDPMSRNNGGLWVDSEEFKRSQGDFQKLAGIPSAEDQQQMFLEMDPGDLLFLHPLILHGSGPNTGAISRRTLLSGFCVMGANQKKYPGECVNDVLSKNSNDGFRTEPAPWK